MSNMTDRLSPVPLTADELLDIKRALTLLHAEMHNPGAARYIAQDVNLDALTEDAIYRIDHVLESMGRAEHEDTDDADWHDPARERFCAD